MTRRLFLRLPEDVTQGPESQLPPATLRALPVPAPLADRVAHVLAYRETFAPGEEMLEQVLPDGALRLIVPLDGGQPWVLGASAQPATVRLAGCIDGWSVTLQPGAAAAVLGLPAGEIGPAVVPLPALWGARAAAWHDRLVAAGDDVARLLVLQQMLAGPAPRRDDGRRAARAAAVIQAGVPSVAALAAALGLGERRLQQLCREQLGLSPRTLGRLARLHRLLRLLRRAPTTPWSVLALDAGYCDQSHLNNEFRILSGLTPGEFARPRCLAGSSKTADRARATVAR